METQTWKKGFNLGIVLTFTIVVSTIAYIKIGWAPVIIVGSSGIIGSVFWYFTYLKRPVDPKSRSQNCLYFGMVIIYL